LNPSKEILAKLEHYCAYQERCHWDVSKKLNELQIYGESQDVYIVHLIEHNFLNEERFANLFSISKFNQKAWGRIRIKNELKFRQISDYLIRNALATISNEAFYEKLDKIALQIWETTHEKSALKKRKKCCDFLLRKGFESDLVYEKIKELEQNA
jgi:regulatory protein